MPITQSKQEGQTVIHTALQQRDRLALSASKLKATTGAFLTALLAMTPAVQAKPFLYVISFPYSGKLENCLSGARKAMKAQGINTFYDDQISKKDRAGKVSGYSSDEYLSVEIECDQKMGITVLGVAGLDNDLTWKTYQALNNAQW